MWKYISGVPKVVKEEKEKKSCPLFKEYEKNRTRKFSAKWQVGRLCECSQNEVSNPGIIDCNDDFRYITL